MILDIKKLFTKGTTIGRYEYLKLTLDTLSKNSTIPPTFSHYYTIYIKSLKYKMKKKKSIIELFFSEFYMLHAQLT